MVRHCEWQEMNRTPLVKLTPILAIVALLGIHYTILASETQVTALAVD